MSRSRPPKCRLGRNCGVCRYVARFDAARQREKEANRVHARELQALVDWWSDTMERAREYADDAWAAKDLMR